jgi:hypothetical protein
MQKHKRTLSGLPVFVDRQYVEESRHQRLLAVHELTVRFRKR